MRPAPAKKATGNPTAQSAAFAVDLALAVRLAVVFCVRDVLLAPTFGFAVAFDAALPVAFPEGRARGLLPALPLARRAAAARAF